MTLLEAVNKGIVLSEDQIDCLITVIAGNCSPVTQASMADQLRNPSKIKSHWMFVLVEIDDKSASFNCINDHRTELLTIRKHLLKGRGVTLTKAKTIISDRCGLRNPPTARMVHQTINYLKGRKDLNELEQQLFKELKL